MQDGMEPDEPHPQAEAAPKKNTQNDMWVYTLNNYTPDEEAKMRALHHVCKQLRYHVFGKEVAASGTPHLQGFVCFTNRKQFNTVKNILGPRCAIFAKSPRSTVAAASGYCKKGDQSHSEWKKYGMQGPHYGLNADYFEYGELPAEKAQGKRSDIARAKEIIDAGGNLSDVADQETEAFVKYFRGLQKLVNYRTSERDFKSNVIVITGDPGTFKSGAISRLKEKYYVVRPTHGNSGCWYDGYEPGRHLSVVFDDFNGGWMPYHNVLELTDRYGCQVQSKGGTVQFKPTFIAFTSNIPAELWYQNDKLPFGALERRINLWFIHSRVEAANDARGLVAGDIVVTVKKGSVGAHPLHKVLVKVPDDEHNTNEWKIPAHIQAELDHTQLAPEAEEELWLEGYGDLDVPNEEEEPELSDDIQYDEIPRPNLPLARRLFDEDDNEMELSSDEYDEEGDSYDASYNSDDDIQ